MLNFVNVIQSAGLQGESQDVLFISFERYKFCVLQWDAETSSLMTRWFLVFLWLAWLLSFLVWSRDHVFICKHCSRLCLWCLSQFWRFYNPLLNFIMIRLLLNSWSRDLFIFGSCLVVKKSAMRCSVHMFTLCHRTVTWSGSLFHPQLIFL